MAGKVSVLMAERFKWPPKCAKAQLKAARQKLDCLGHKIVAKYKKTQPAPSGTQ